MSDSDAVAASPEETELEHEEECEEAEPEESIVEPEPASPPLSPGGSPRDTIHDRSIKGQFNVNLAKNQYPRSDPRRYRFFSIEKLLVDAVKILSLPAQARKIFKEDGTLVTRAEDINERDTLFVSCGEPFVRVLSSPKRRSPAASPAASPAKESPAKEPQSPKDAAEEKPKMTRVEREKLAFNRVVALSHRTTDETMKLATASVWDSLTKEGKAKVGSIRAIRDDVQDGLLMQLLQKQGMLPATGEIQADLRNWAVDMFKGLKIDEVKFVVGGPSQCGKTTLLYALAKVLVKKLRLSEENGKYLVFPISFELQSLTIECHMRLLRLFVSNAFDALEFSQLKVVPYLETLRKWFMLSVFGTLLTPPAIDEVDFIDIAGLNALAKSLNTALKDDDDHSLENFVEAVCQFPGNFARCFGLKDALFIIDSFEFCNVMYAPSDEIFPRSLKVAYLADYLCLELMKSPYLVSMQNERLFMDCFTCNDAVLLDVQGLVKEPVSDGYIQLWNPAFRIEIGDCLGCPGYIYRFMKICDLIIQSEDNAAYPTAYSMVRTRAELSRQHLIKQEIVKLTRLLCDAGHEHYTKDLLNEISDSERMTAKFVVYADIEDEEEEEEAESPPSPSTASRSVASPSGASRSLASPSAASASVAQSRPDDELTDIPEDSPSPPPKMGMTLKISPKK